MSAPPERPRARDLNICIGTMSPGPHNAITDVLGVCVGHVSLIRGSGKLIPGQGPVRTGVTAIRVEGDEAVAAAIHTINGFGYVTSAEIVREWGRLRGPVMLTGTLNVNIVADAVKDWGLGAIDVSPVVAECYDGFLSDVAGRHVRSEHVVQAIESAVRAPSAGLSSYPLGGSAGRIDNLGGRPAFPPGTGTADVALSGSPTPLLAGSQEPATLQVSANAR